MVGRRSLRLGTSQSCGCLRLEVTTRHGKYLSKEYRAWQQARKRCRNEKDKDYPAYGGRGITFSEGWDDPIQFMDDMGPCPEGFSLGRKDNDGPYCKDNCEWQSGMTQQRNRRNTIFATLGGVTKPLVEWAEIKNMKMVTIRKRIESGWSIEKALETPINEKFRSHGKEKTS